MESGNTTRVSAKSAARKRNRKSRASREPASVSGASGSVPTGSLDGNAADGESAGVRAGALDEGGAVSEVGALLIDVVCGMNRAKLRVDGLRNGSKTPCVYMETDAEDLGQGQGQDEGQGEDTRQTRSGSIFRSVIIANTYRMVGP